jgi:hypothetical protein
MTGMPEFNYPAFHGAAAAWRDQGFTVLSPAENFDGDLTLSHATYLRAALAQVISADAIALLPGWRNSKGARVEARVAAVIDLQFFDALTRKSIPVPSRFGPGATSHSARRKKRNRARKAAARATQ